MKQQIIDWVNNNPSLVTILLFLATVAVSIIGYFLKRFFSRERHGKNLMQKQKSGDNSENYQAGRDINTHK